MLGFDRFNLEWASAGVVLNPTPVQADAGFAYLGPAPPTVEEFNAILQWNDEKDNWLYNQIASVIGWNGTVPADPGTNQLLDAILALIAANSGITPGTYVLRAGDSMTGNLDMTGIGIAVSYEPPTALTYGPWDIVPIGFGYDSVTGKLRVRQANVDLGTIDLNYVPPAGGNFVPISGGTMTGPLILSGNATVNLGAVTLQQLNAAIVAPTGFLPLTGGTLSGPGNLAVLGNLRVGATAPADMVASHGLLGGISTPPTGILQYNLYPGSGGHKFVGGGYGVQFGFGTSNGYVSMNYTTTSGGAGGVAAFQTGRQIFTPQGHLTLAPNGNGYKATATSAMWSLTLFSTQSQVNPQDYTGGLAELRQLKPTWFQVHDSDDDSLSEYSVGIVFADALSVMPELSSQPMRLPNYRTGVEEDVPTMNVNPIFYAMINALQEMATRLEALEGAA
jgi:hypothetical protein